MTKKERTKLPAHLRENPITLRVLRTFANGMRGLYGAPVYLCGSALLDSNSDPRDWDIRIDLPDEQFALRYGGGRMGRNIDGRIKVVQDWDNQALSGEWTRLRWRWSDDCVKHSLRGMRDTGLTIDFQVYPKTHAQQLYKGKPRLRLDTR